MSNNLQSLYELITEWGSERGLLTPDNKERQVLKLIEEMGELAASVARDDVNEVKDALGDIFVVWTMLMNKYQLDANEVVGDVYKIIDARKGISIDGVFIKEKDLALKSDAELRDYLNSSKLSQKHHDWLLNFLNLRHL